MAEDTTRTRGESAEESRKGAIIILLRSGGRILVVRDSPRELTKYQERHRDIHQQTGTEPQLKWKLLAGRRKPDERSLKEAALRIIEEKCDLRLSMRALGEPEIESRRDHRVFFFRVRVASFELVSPECDGAKVRIVTRQELAGLEDFLETHRAMLEKRKILPPPKSR